MREDDVRYYRHRAEIELERARLANEPSVSHVHHQLAEAYLAKLASDKPVKVEAS